VWRSERSSGELEPGGDVDREDAATSAPANQRGRFAVRIASLAVAEQCVDHELGLAERVARCLVNDYRESSKNCQLLRWHRGEVLGSCRQRDRYLRSCDREMAGGDKAAAAVSTRTRHDDDRAAAGVATE